MDFESIFVFAPLSPCSPFRTENPLKGKQFDNQSALDPIETVSLLAAAMEGRHLNVQDKYGRTPLHYAAYRGAMISAMHIAEVGY